MKIVVLSDSHIPISAEDLPKQVYESLTDVDLILHAGDLVALSVLEKLKRFTEVRAVYGNMDQAEVRKVLPQKDIINCGNFKIGLCHGCGPPNNLIEKLKNEFSDKVDIIIFGHSHAAICEKREGVLFFNPGSPTDNVFSPYKSFGVIEIVDKKINSEIIRIN